MSAVLPLLRHGRGHLPRLLLAAALSALAYLSAVALMGVSAWLISRAAEHPEASALTVAAVAVRTLGLSRGVARYAERLVGHDVALRAVADLRVAVFSSLVRRDAAGRRTGAVLSGAVADVEALQDLWLRCLLPAASAAVVAVVAVAACWWWLPAAGLVLLAGLGASLVLVPLLAARAARHEQRRAGLRAAHQVAVLDVVHGAADLLVHGRMPQALADAGRAAAALAEGDRRSALRTAAGSATSAVLQGATAVLVALVALPAVQDGRLPRVGLAVVVLVALAAFEPVLPLADAGALWVRSTGAAARLADLLVDVPEQVAQEVTGPEVLRLQGVRVQHAGAGRPALEGVDLELRPGRCVVVVGASGAGKSTLLRVLAGQLAPSAGSALLGGTPVAEVADDERARHVVLAEQDGHLFHASLRDNLRLAKVDATDDELLAAADLAGLGDWVRALPEGLYTPVGERGAQVSGGERTRLCVARALLTDAPFVLLDEPTEGLDPAAADALVRRLLRTQQHRGLLVVTHRTAGLEEADEVVELARGRVLRREAPAHPLAS